MGLHIRRWRGGRESGRGRGGLHGAAGRSYRQMDACLRRQRPRRGGLELAIPLTGNTISVGNLMLIASVVYTNTRVLVEDLVWVGFLVLCFLYKINPN